MKLNQFIFYKTFYLYPLGDLENKTFILTIRKDKREKEIAKHILRIKAVVDHLITKCKSKDNENQYRICYSIPYLREKDVLYEYKSIIPEFTNNSIQQNRKYIFNLFYEFDKKETGLIWLDVDDERDYNTLRKFKLAYIFKSKNDLFYEN